ncbi:ferredoxin III, nif-specific [Plasticicumulans acidivorans]|uniref:Ferredoxin III n=1 Tax=Plasticicumulans acidivorans TaxID=886464 RepID=A0A317MSC0_9GAMM|nr:ferredoxin III, nif-specific [Plasticicumulans acidivorans]PWV59018.1 Nif-specific ferredoxin III [Plasticicumulans acidivorans]
MSDVIVGRTRGGSEWTPAFVVDLNQKTCIGCGRCFKVCPRDVFDLVEREEDELDEDLDEDQMMVMSIKDAMDCIGCGACFRVCPKGCHTHQAMPV